METRKLGRFEIIGVLGKGAMGVVYKANDPLLDRVVAIKTINLSHEGAESAEFEARFYQEAKSAGGLNHPNIVTVYDIGTTGDTVYMALEYLQGQELRELMIPGTPLAVSKAIDIATQVADGLAFAHEHHVVHRDIKPANIMMVREGLAKITDFGIARRRASEVKTETGIVLGSPRYMSPEQVMGKRADHRSDIFSLGVMLYEMLTGSAPFTGENLNAMMFQIVNQVPPPPRLSNPLAPQMLDYIVAKALAKSLDDRYQNAKNMADDLRECGRQLLAIETGKKLDSLAAEMTWPPGESRTLIDADISSELDNLPTPKSRRDDAQDAEPAPAFTLAKSFDSTQATLRMAQQAGMERDFGDYIKTMKVAHLGEATLDNLSPYTPHAPAAPPINPSVPAPMPPAIDKSGWSTLDKIIFAGGLALVVAVAAAFFTG